MTENEIRCVVTLLRLRTAAGDTAPAVLLERFDAHMAACAGVSASVPGCEGGWLFTDPTHALEAATAGLNQLMGDPSVAQCPLSVCLTADYGFVRLAGETLGGPALEGALEALLVAPDQTLAVTAEVLRHLREDLRRRVWRLAPIGEPAVIPPPQTLFAYDWDNQLGRRRDMPVRPSGDHALSPASLELRHGAKTLRVEARDCPLSVGRDEACRLRLHGPSASRFHGRIEFDGERFVFVDDSRNGSYLMTAHGDEIFLRGERVPLTGAGVISPGVPLMRQPGEVLRYRCYSEEPVTSSA